MTFYTFVLILTIMSFFSVWFGMRAMVINTLYKKGVINSVDYHRHLDNLYRLIVGITGGTTCAVVVLDVHYNLVDMFFAAMTTAFL